MPEREEQPVEQPERPGSGAGRAAAAARMDQQHLWVDLQVRRAMERGDFDDLPGAGKPIEGLGTEHDPDWWLKRLVEREKVSALPPALSLRKEDLELDELLDREGSEKAVVKVLEDFNRRIVEARRQLQGGPPVITPLRDVDTEVAAWRDRREARRTAQAELLASNAGRDDKGRRRWFGRRPR